MKRLVSFGFRFGPVEGAEAVVDCRGIRNPHHDKELWGLTGEDERVARKVLGSPGAVALLMQIIGAAQQVETVAVGCQGGRHRSVALVDAAAFYLRKYHPELEVIVLHRDMRRVR